MATFNLNDQLDHSGAEDDSETLSIDDLGSFVQATDKDGAIRVGWIPGGLLEEIVGQTVKLHPEPLSEDFVVVTGTVGFPTAGSPATPC